MDPGFFCQWKLDAFIPFLFRPKCCSLAVDYKQVKSNPVNMDTTGLWKVSVLSGLNEEKMQRFSFPRDKANCPYQCGVRKAGFHCNLGKFPCS